MEEHHELMGGKLHVYRRARSSNWQCSTYLNGKNWRQSTGEDSLARAKHFAEDWYLSLRGKKHAGVLKVGKTFNEVADQFLLEYEVITEGERSPAYVEMIKIKLRVHLRPFFGETLVSEITPGFVQQYRLHRMTSKIDEETGDFIRPARSTIHHEIVTLRQVVKTANRHGWLPYLPDLSAPYKTSGKISHRAWFSPEEYKRLYKATRERVNNPKNPRWKKACEKLHDYVLFISNTGLRPDEAKRLQFRDVAIVTDEATGERILEIEVRGKRGVGYCKSMPGAVTPYKRLKSRSGGTPSELIFGKIQRELLNSILTNSI